MRYRNDIATEDPHLRVLLREAYNILYNSEVIRSMTYYEFFQEKIRKCKRPYGFGDGGASGLVRSAACINCSEKSVGVSGLFTLL